jgi:ribosomal protein L16 Arg81 hydroxylase
MTMDFDAVIAPLPRAQFLSDYWDKAFVRIPGAAGRFSYLLSWDELDAVLEQHRLAPPRLKLFQNGQAIEPQRFLTPSRFGVPRLDAGGLAACLAQGATLILDDVQEVAPRVQALMHVFQDALHSDAFANLYASWHGGNAFDLHWDPQSSIVIQLRGRKRWQVFAPTRRNPLDGEAEPPPRPTGAPVWDGMMEDGDALYLPRGWWHAAFPVGEPSLHLTVSLTPPNGLDFLGWTVSRLRAREEVRANLPALDGPAALTAHVKKLRGLIDQALTGEAAAEFLREWEANIRPSPHVRLNAMASGQLAPPQGSSRIRLAALNRLFLKPREGFFEFQAAGRLWNVPAELAPAFERLSNTRDIGLDELAAGLAGPAAAKLAQAISVLARAGVVLVEDLAPAPNG